MSRFWDDLGEESDGLLSGHLIILELELEKGMDRCLIVRSTIAWRQGKQVSVTTIGGFDIYANLLYDAREQILEIEIRLTIYLIIRQVIFRRRKNKVNIIEKPFVWQEYLAIDCIFIKEYQYRSWNGLQPKCLHIS